MSSYDEQDILHKPNRLCRMSCLLDFIVGMPASAIIFIIRRI